MKTKNLKRLTAVVLALLMIVPLTTVPAFALTSVDYAENFNSLTKADGEKLTASDNFVTIPSLAEVWEVSAGNKAVKIPLCNKDGGSVATGNDGHVDANVKVKNPALSWSANGTVALEAKYYFSADATGKVQMQLYQYTTEGGAPKNWLNLFSISSEKMELLDHLENPYTGQLLTREAWNTVTMVLNLETGVADVYLNGSFAYTDNLGYTQLTAPANSFIVGKINKNQTITGFYAIDDVRVYTPGDDELVTVPLENAAGQKLSYVRSADGRKMYGNRILKGDGYTPVYFDDTEQYEGVVETIAKASARVDAHSGLRFVSYIDLAKINRIYTLKENGEIKDFRIGTLITLDSYKTAAGAGTREALDALAATGSGKTYVDVRASYGQWFDPSHASGLSARDGYAIFAGTIANIQRKNLNRAMYGVGYAELKLYSGASVIFYGAGHTATVSSLASGVLNSVGINDLTAEEISRLQGIGGTFSDTGTGSGTYNARAFGGSVLFELTKSTGKVYARLVSAGGNGFRLQTSDADGWFSDTGAAQALANYMGESVVYPYENALTVTASNGVMKMTSATGSYATLALSGSFSLKFYNKSGTLVSEVTDISISGGKTVLSGSLTGGEGIFGGGERFDSSNHRGKSMLMYSNDGWNNTNSTYMPIPVFSTTRGGGVYVNRYEQMTFDWGKTSANTWSVTLNKETMDCYFYATEKIPEVLQAYTDLTGNAEMPDEWYQGVIVCRYGPDFSVTYTKDETLTTNKDGAPAGRSFQTIIESFEKAGLPTPKAVITEGWGYGGVIVSQKARDRLQEAIDYLHGKGIKLMLYMRVASTIPTGTPTEYLVSANVNGTVTNLIPNIGGTANPDVAYTGTYGTVRYIDITNPDAMDWYCNTFYGDMIRMGIDGVKIDFCETMPDTGTVYSDKTQEYRVSYNCYDGTVIERGTEHHAYPTMFISQFYKAANAIKDAANGGESDGFMVLSRGGGIGSQRNPYLWAGDQARQFDKLSDQLLSVINSGISGVPFITYDMAGYRYNGSAMSYGNAESLAYESEIMARAVEFTAFTSSIQTHGTVRNAFELSAESQWIYKNYVDLHTALAPYITRLSAEACRTGMPVVRHLVLQYQNDANVYNINDEFMLGDGLLVAPILTRGTTSRTVYLPAGTWINLLTGETVTGGKTITVNATLSQIPVFLNTASSEADFLRGVFAGAAWCSVTGSEETSDPNVDDALDWAAANSLCAYADFRDPDEADRLTWGELVDYPPEEGSTDPIVADQLSYQV